MGSNRPPIFFPHNLVLTSITLTFLLAPTANAISIPPTQSEVNTLVNAVGMQADNHPYVGVTPLGGNLGLSLGLEVTLVRLPPDFVTQMSSLGVSGLPSSLPAMRVQAIKTIGTSAMLGLGWLNFMGFTYWGAFGQIAIAQPEEGLHWALRLNWGWTIQQNAIASTCWTPALVIGKKLDWSEFYAGGGAQIITGTLSQSVNLGPLGTQTLTYPGNATNYVAFIGAIFTMGSAGMSLAAEMSYNTGGGNTLGFKLGFQM